MSISLPLVLLYIEGKKVVIVCCFLLEECGELCCVNNELTVEKNVNVHMYIYVCIGISNDLFSSLLFFSFSHCCSFIEILLVDTFTRDQ